MKMAERRCFKSSPFADLVSTCFPLADLVEFLVVLQISGDG